MIRKRAFALALALGVGLAAVGVSAQASSYRVLYAFRGGSDGAYPTANLISVGGILYGATLSGGGAARCAPIGCGTVFSLNPATGVEKVLFVFKGGDDGLEPEGALIDVNDTLYGTTYAGGGVSGCFYDATCGTVFALDLKTGAETLVHAFGRGTDGQQPEAGLIHVGGTLYGTTYRGGGGASFLSMGTVFSLDPATRKEDVVYRFKGYSANDGMNPAAALINVDGKLYGTTVYGGNYEGADGTVFSLDLATGTEGLIHAFGGGNDGSHPASSVIAVGGTLYGTTTEGGSPEGPETIGFGTVFAVDPVTQVESVVHAFKGRSDGADPMSSLVNVGGNLKGTTEDSGRHGYGVVFTLNLKTGIQTVRHHFRGGSDGAQAQAGLLSVGGVRYGTTASGGGSANCQGGCGTVFAITP